MRTVTPSEALRFVEGAELPAPPRGAAPESPGSTVATAFDTAKNQAAVVGSDVISFVQGVTPERRRVLINSSLLAQLLAKKRRSAGSSCPAIRSIPSGVPVSSSAKT